MKIICGITQEKSEIGTNDGLKRQIYFDLINRIGIDGKTPRLRKEAGDIQWGYGDDQWIDLVKLEEITGPAGVQGEQGEKGDRGIDGEHGISAFQAAVNSGYSGTEEEFGMELALLSDNNQAVSELKYTKAGINPSSGHLKNEHIAPVCFNSAGADFRTGYYYSDELKFSGDISVEIVFRTPPEGVYSEGTLFSTCGKDCSEKGILVRLYSHPGGNRYNSINYTVNGTSTNDIYQFEADTVYHLVMTSGESNKKVNYYLNGRHMNSVSYTGGVEHSGLWLGGGFSQSGNHKCSIYKVRIYNMAVSQSKVRELFNFGDPLSHELDGPGEVEFAGSCIAEYMPFAALSDRWLDTSGNSRNLFAMEKPVVRTAPLRSLKSVIKRTEPFFANIADGISSKEIIIPVSHRVSAVTIRNRNSVELQNVVVSVTRGSTVIFTETIPSIAAGSGHNISIDTMGAIGQNRIYINASGNTSSGGIEVFTVAEWAG